ncbi:hypothetical protein B0H17DRAFT_1092310 [Mycena rosella]|uniref:FAR-17a/AIG1-like protein n=1 Tax=Mycena rosella TaxID=1033263 RepID=A0AAD7CU37_MYCRO|nr:hypothetical protein B0H17DRAFT_1092310 [Mycena rosella]
MRSLSAFLPLDPFDTRHTLVTSPFLSPRVLAAIRLTMACYTLVTLIFSVVWSAMVQKDAAGFFSYFTHLTYSGLCGYFFASGIQTAMYARHGQKAYPLQRWAKPWRFLHLTLLSTITAFPILVSLVFWGILADATTFDTRYDAWSAISVHLLNSVFALFEILLTNTPASAWILLGPGLLLLIGYVGVIYVTYATQGFYAYSFMDPKGHPGKLAIYIIGIGLAECIIFAIVHGVVVLRQRGVARFLPAPSKPVDDEKSIASTSDGKPAWEDVDIDSAIPADMSKFEV